MELLDSLWDLVRIFFWGFIFVASIWALFVVISDLFRDKQLNGWWKALWLLFLVFVPVLTTLIYIIARGSGMAERSAKEMEGAKNAADEYIRSVAAQSPAEEIARAKALLDDGVISADDFETLKQRALRA
ncbi:phospholipase D-like protein [Mycolicibacterium mucogenicum 261Sha1.1M5]|uniref:SHOCT domain-containing protein n=1 Tax=Leucobacter aridicollis TaxID=283878 RepID=UPI000EB12DF3|nr:SHOCT domain-containing protein [Leucobacter aridicollis]MCS3428054.1 ABC-type multidrug transport system fused ATPase/permease subunit [Leucobacter aridicollis]RKQ94683.1 phospholipase D-like protein [Mycolicibacterium mucogenicum 261Sha1.1M5]